MEIFNLNNPFLKLLAAVEMNQTTLYAFARYQILLGFGRLDDLTFAVGAKLPF
jgi:hypothetical protein